MGSRRAVRGTVIGAAIAGLVLAQTVATALTRAVPAYADSAPPAGTPATVSADPLPTVQINGVVWAQVIVGNTVYATGDFTSARPAGSAAGQNETPRTYLLAYNITTGALITSFNHTINAQGRAIAATPDGTRIFVGGEFTQVDGRTVNRMAEFNTATGALVSTFNPGFDSSVLAIAATNTTVYAGGAFSRASGNDRSRLAAFTVSSGALTGWNAGADADVDAVTLSPDGSRLIVGGHFAQLTGQSRYGLGGVDLVTGAVTPWTSAPVIRDAGKNSAITTLTTDGTKIYGGGYVFGTGGNFEGRFAIDQTGNVIFLDDCHGDTYSVAPVGGVLYSVGHSHMCSNINGFPEVTPRVAHRALADTTVATQTVKTNTQNGYANFAGQPAPTQLDWYPNLQAGTFTGQTQAAWSVVGNSTYISLGGEFPKVNATQQQGLVRFAVAAIAPNRVGPVASSAITPSATVVANTVRLTWGTTYDIDNAVLTYGVYRDGGANPIGTTSADTRFWTVPSPTQTFTDTSPPNGTHTYVIKAKDPFGNPTVSAASNPVTIAGANNPPTANFTSSCTNLVCSFNGSSSGDSDGTVVGYAWTFGDGGTATGATPQHTYAAGGSYPVTLTVTDNGGATGQRTITVTATAAGTGIFANDTFNRTVSNGLGTANAGGPWTPATSANLSVTPGTATFRLPSAAAATTASLTSTTSADPDITATFSLSAVSTGSGAYVSAEGRRIDSTHVYRGNVKLLSTGSVQVTITKLDGSATDITLASAVTVPGTYSAGQAWKLELNIRPNGASTSIALTAWPATAAEPTSPQATATDSSTTLSAAGGVGIRTYLSGSATAGLAVSVNAFAARSNA